MDNDAKWILAVAGLALGFLLVVMITYAITFHNMSQACIEAGNQVIDDNCISQTR